MSNRNHELDSVGFWLGCHLARFFPAVFQFSSKFTLRFLAYSTCIIFRPFSGHNYPHHRSIVEWNSIIVFHTLIHNMWTLLFQTYLLSFNCVVPFRCLRDICRKTDTLNEKQICHSRLTSLYAANQCGLGGSTAKKLWKTFNSCGAMKS